MKTTEEFIEQNWMHFRDYCWVSMDQDGQWYLHRRKPSLEGVSFFSTSSIPLFEIYPAQDWTKSCQQIKKTASPADWVGKLCWFWDFSEDNPAIGVLSEYRAKTYSFIDRRNTEWRHCRPLTEDELKNPISNE